MAKKREPVVDENDILGDEELEDDDDLELDDWDDDEVDDDDEFEFDDDDDDDDSDDNEERFTKVYEEAKKRAEEAVIEQLAEGNQDSPIYKGLQRVISKKDKELEETRTALAGVIQTVQQLQSSTNMTKKESEFLANIMEEMLDEDSRKVFQDRKEKHNKETSSQSELDQVKYALQYMLQQQQQGQTSNNASYSGTEDQFEAYRKQAEEELREFVKDMGYDPEDSNLDYGDPNEGFVHRMSKLRKSLANVKGKGVNDVKSKKKRVRTRDSSYSGTTETNELGADLVQKAMAKTVSKMRKQL